MRKFSDWAPQYGQALIEVYRQTVCTRSYSDGKGNMARLMETKMKEPDFDERYIDPTGCDFWDFGTNAVVPVSMGVAAIGFGPGEYKLAHMTNERCGPKKAEDACRFYTQLIGLL